MKAPRVSKYFWLLDNDLPPEFLKGYRGALAEKKQSGLKQIVELLEAHVPLSPKAYVTSSFNQCLEGSVPQDLLQELSLVLARFEEITHCSFGGGGRHKPLLLTVQGDFCGAIRNLGCTQESFRAMVHEFGNAAACTRYVDFLENFSSIVLNCPHIDFRQAFHIDAKRDSSGSEFEKLPEEEFLEMTLEYQNLVSQKIGKPFPAKPERQLLLALIHSAKIGKQSGGDEILVKAQAIQTMARSSTSGIAYTRNPYTGKKGVHGVYTGPDHKKAALEPVTEDDSPATESATLRQRYPQIFSSIKSFLPKIEACFRDVMEAEFVTDEDGRLYFTNFDKAHVTARAAVVSAIDLNIEGRISDREAALRIQPKDIEVLLHPTLDEASRAKLKDLGSTGATAAPGTAVGHVFFKMADAMEFYRSAVKSGKDKRVILIADELLISDTPGIGIIQGLVTKAAGIASHAAVMARANGIPCIVGYRGLEISHDGKTAEINGKKLPAGTLVTLEAGTEGRLFMGEGALQNLSYQEGVIKDVAQLVDRVVKQEKIPMEIRVNINNAKDAQTGLHFAADGVGLCRTENMFMEAESLREIRNIVFTQDISKCQDSLKKLEEIQFSDFLKIFQVMKNRTVNIRLMDLPLHDFVPQTKEDFDELVSQLPHLGAEHLRLVAEGLREHNPMLGLRACRFGLITPDVYNMQIRAIVRAAYAAAQSGIEVHPGIMFPLVFSQEELSRLKSRVLEIEQQIREQLKLPHGSKIRFKVGSMIELPAAALGADRLARIGEFFAFGTNDLTQTTLGMSRDDSAHYLPAYLEKQLIPYDPFKILSEQVKELILIAVTRGHRVRHDVSFGICGEQGGDPSSLLFCLENGLNYVSCSPFRVLPVKTALIHVALAHANTESKAA